jgi:hypothetical protein
MIKATDFEKYKKKIHALETMVRTLKEKQITDRKNLNYLQRRMQEFDYLNDKVEETKNLFTYYQLELEKSYAKFENALHIQVSAAINAFKITMKSLKE